MEFMVEANNRGWLKSSEYVIINVDLDGATAKKALKILNPNQEIKKLMVGTFQVRATTVEDSQTAQYSDFKKNITYEYQKKFNIDYVRFFLLSPRHSFAPCFKFL